VGYGPLGLLFLALASAAPSVGHAQDAEDIKVISRDQIGSPTLIRGKLGTLGSGDHGRSAVEFLRQFSVEQMNATGAEALTVRLVSTDDMDHVHIRIQQSINGLPVVGTEVVVHADAGGAIYAVNGTFVSAASVPGPALAGPWSAVEDSALANGIGGELIGSPALVYILDRDDQPRLGWHASLENGDPATALEVTADAATGAIISQLPRARNLTTVTIRQRARGGPVEISCLDLGCDDRGVQKLHFAFLDANQYYLTIFGRNSFSNVGSNISIYYREYITNEATFIEGDSLFQIGKGDGVTYAAGPLDAFDVVAHEFTHAAVDSSSKLVPQLESGALDEAFADIVAASGEALLVGGFSARNFMMADVSDTPGIPDDGVRYLNDPARDGGSKDLYPQRFTTPQPPSPANDFGGVHVNAGIGNLAYYLLIAGGVHPRQKTTINVPQLNFDDALQVFFNTLTNSLTPNSNFQNARDLTAMTAEMRLGRSEANSVRTAWCAVGVGACPVNDALFLRQNIPARLVPNETVFAAVTYRNIASNTWTPNAGFKLANKSPGDETRWGFARVDLNGATVVRANAEYSFIFGMAAPAVAGTYGFRTSMFLEGAGPFPVESWSPLVNIEVSGATPSGDAFFVSQSAPAALDAGTRGTITVTMRNIGQTTWTRGSEYRLANETPGDPFSLGFHRAELPPGVQVAPGQEYTFTFEISAPEAPGIYFLRTRMVRENVEFFGAYAPFRAIQVR